MKLYEVNTAIEELIERLEPDSETGEIRESADTDAILTELHEMNLEKSRILEYLAKLVLNGRSEAAALREEEKRLSERRRRLERKEERLISILDRECAGIKTDCGVATVRYRTVQHVEVGDSAKAVGWLKRHGMKDCFRVHEPEVNKADVKKLLAAGTKVPGVELIQEQSCSLS